MNKNYIYIILSKIYPKIQQQDYNVIQKSVVTLIAIYKKMKIKNKKYLNLLFLLHSILLKKLKNISQKTKKINEIHFHQHW